MIKFMRRIANSTLSEDFIYTRQLIDKTERNINKIVERYKWRIFRDLSKLKHIDMYQKYYGKMNVKIDLNLESDETSLNKKFNVHDQINIKDNVWALDLLERDIKIYQASYKKRDALDGYFSEKCKLMLCEIIVMKEYVDIRKIRNLREKNSRKII